jgi:hypothetical protein
MREVLGRGTKVAGFCQEKLQAFEISWDYFGGKIFLSPFFGVRR